MKLSVVSESTSNTDRNALAALVARQAARAFGADAQLRGLLSFKAPQVDESTADDQPAVVTVRLGGRTPEAIAVDVYGPHDIKMEMSGRLAGLLGVPRLLRPRSVDGVGRYFAIMAKIILGKIGVKAGASTDHGS